MASGTDRTIEESAIVPTVMIRSRIAPNPSPMTLDGTVTYIVGRARVAIIDPGPDDAGHLEWLSGCGRIVAILLTHDHPDHSAGAPRLSRLTGAPVLGMAAGALSEGDVIETDSGRLVALHTPGHTPDHVAFHETVSNELFCGDLMMGGLDTALVAPPEGDLGSYLRSLERVRSLKPSVIHPAHGPSSSDADEWIGRYLEHRRKRLRQVLAALENGPLDVEGVATAVYGGTIPAALRSAAVGAAEAYLAHLSGEGRVRQAGDDWHRVDGDG